MRKNKLLLLLALLLTAATGAWAAAENETIIFNNLGLANAYELTSATLTVGNINLDFAKGTGSSTPAFYTSGGGTVRLYKGNTMSIDASGATITKIVFTYASEVTPEFSTGSYNSSTKTWEGEATTLTVTNAYTTNTQIRIMSMDVYYSAPAGYTVSLKDGVKDADKWTVKVGEGQAQALPIGGLKGDGSETVTLQYNGRLKVKGVKATSDAAPAPSVPDGAISGVFSVSSTKKVYFSKGNLRYASGAWSFFDNQYDYYDSHSDDAWDKFGWSTSATTYGMNTSTSGGDYSGDFVDWGATMGTGWFTLNKDEWTYLLNTRTVNGGTGDGKSYTLGQSVNDKPGVVIYPDNYTGEVYSGSDWAKFESAGCVFLPAAGRRAGLSVNNLGERGYYWSATPNGTNNAYGVLFSSGVLAPASNTSRYYGSSVRLVREVATSDEEQAPAAPALNITSPSVGQVIGSDGKNYAYGSLPTGVTAVAMIAKVSGTSGLAIALADEEGTMNWDTAVTTAAAHTPTFTGGTWRLPTQNEWKQMFASFGGNDASYSGLNTAITAAGGTALVMYSNYCSSTESGSNVYYAIFFGSGVDWQNGSKTLSFKVRPCLAF